jgi:hypothetical protein
MTTPSTEALQIADKLWQQGTFLALNNNTDFHKGPRQTLAKALDDFAANLLKVTRRERDFKILAAIIEERDRCVKIAEAERFPGSQGNEACNNIAAAIRREPGP